ncbi:hypothetical protein F8B43_0007 [Methylorubrum populi]|uniref:Peptidase S24/S26A/S26B/S26C domain-containing protein n=1 Tax=Methylorubrum populi TaxID=223967 RepID=A0A833JAI2_9HYPH|nr:hypothetical protein F8B43_0007 [Methylorubrum populi]
MQAQGIDIDATKVSKTVAGRRKIQTEEMFPVLKFFGIDPDRFFREYYMGAGEEDPPKTQLMTESIRNRNDKIRYEKATRSMPNAGLPERIETASGGLPIFGVSVGGDARSRTLFNGQRLGEVARPMSLANNGRAYATYVHGDSMEPRYEAGEIVLVNPEKGYRKGNYVVAQVYDNDGDPPFGYVKRFVSFGDELVLEQLNPPAEEERFMRFPRERVVSVHRIVGTLDE